MGYVKKQKVEQNCFNIIDDLSYLLNICSAKALSKELNLIFSREAGFPKEMVGDKEKFDFVIFTILDHFIEHLRKADIVLTGKTNSPTNSGLLLGFNIKGPKTEHINSELLLKTLGTTHKTLNEYIKEKGPLEKYELGLFQCKEIVGLMSGDIKIAEPTPEEVEIGIELPFDTRDITQHALEIPKLSIYQTERLNDYTYKWTPVILKERPKSEKLADMKAPERALEQMPIRFLPKEDHPLRPAPLSKELRDQKADLLAKIKQEAEQSRTPLPRGVNEHDYLDDSPMPLTHREGSRSAPPAADEHFVIKEEYKAPPEDHQRESSPLAKLDETEYIFIRGNSGNRMDEYDSAITPTSIVSKGSHLFTDRTVPAASKKKLLDSGSLAEVREECTDLVVNT